MYKAHSSLAYYHCFILKPIAIYKSNYIFYFTTFLIQQPLRPITIAVLYHHNQAKHTIATLVRNLS